MRFGQLWSYYLRSFHSPIFLLDIFCKYFLINASLFINISNLLEINEWILDELLLTLKYVIQVKSKWKISLHQYFNFTPYTVGYIPNDTTRHTTTLTQHAAVSAQNLERWSARSNTRLKLKTKGRLKAF